ncbi:MAG: DUF3050 domain-containing protein [Bdellovibrionota bacterium]
MKITSYQELEIFLDPIKRKLLNHPLYNEIDDIISLQIFMESHAFAVWDFMSLLKSLQRHFTSVEVPWVPPASALAARLVNEIVLAEESDEIEPGHYRGHFDLYVEAMGEVEANGRLILEFVDLIKAQYSVEYALNLMPIPHATKQFVRTTMLLASKSSHEVASAFLLGREDIIPEMFQNILPKVQSQTGLPCHAFRTYLKRHIELDADTHGPMGVKLLRELCGVNAKKWQEVADVAQLALQARIHLWDGLIDEIKKERVDISATV